jgi:hypothetical protein
LFASLTARVVLTGVLIENVWASADAARTRDANLKSIVRDVVWVTSGGERKRYRSTVVKGEGSR